MLISAHPLTSQLLQPRGTPNPRPCSVLRDPPWLPGPGLGAQWWGIRRGGGVSGGQRLGRGLARPSVPFGEGVTGQWVHHRPALGVSL